LANDVSALQTALHIRKEELHDMDVKADALERRILEGIMDQSRALLLSKGMKAATLGNEKHRNLSNASHSTLGALPPSAASQALSMAIKTRSSPARRNVPIGLSPASRRIMSLNQISHNAPNGAQGYKAANTGLGAGLGSGLLKRSQSVRSQGQRKISWNDGMEKSRSVSQAIEEDKENAVLGDIHDVEEPHDDDADDAGSTGTVTITERESGVSYATSTGYADSVMTSDRSDFDDRRTSSGSEYTYTTGSYITGTDLSRRSSQVGTVDEESEGDESASEAEQTDAEGGAEGVVARNDEADEYTPVPVESKVVLFRGPADVDSGLGSDLPTAAGMSGDETDYFRRAAEEAASSVGG
jgi:hypothetical protein